ncbi:MAG: glycoside hydrolase family 65 protein [Chloroflexi bacterium]|nr:glycoside hydrolase family 65 protein [Chloroflexota bacterium]
MWIISEDIFEPKSQHHKETIFTIGNGYLSTRGAFEEGYPADSRATFVHGMFDRVPIAFTELANATDWLSLIILLNGECFSLDSGTVESYDRHLDLRTGLLIRNVRWRSPSGCVATLKFERFASLEDEHLLCLRCQVEPEFDGTVEVRAGLNGNMDNEGIMHWRRVAQGQRDSIAFLHTRTRATNLDLALAMKVDSDQTPLETAFWDVENFPTLSQTFTVKRSQILSVEKFVGIATSRDTSDPVGMAVEHAGKAINWESAFEAHQQAWAQEWKRADVIIEGDDEAQIAVRFSLFQLLIAAPRHDERVNIGAKTLSGFGYRGHAFWDTEIFMLPVFTYTSPHIARNLLDYRFHTLPAARAKAKENGFEGAWFAWESADTGEEVTPTWVPDFKDKKKLARVWTGDLAIHISADVAYGTYQYWRVTGDDDWFRERGAELILDTASFFGTRAEWIEARNRYEYNDVIGPDEYHDHVNNNAYTNCLAQWNLETAFTVLDWLKVKCPEKLTDLTERLNLTEVRLEKWRKVAANMHLSVKPDGLIEQFDGFFDLKDFKPADYEPRTKSMHEIFGIEAANECQAIKQPDVLMVQYLLHDHYSGEAIRANYNYYNLRTDHTYGSSLGPSIQAIVACMMGYPEDGYEHFVRAARADLRDVRGNAGDGIHGASAGGTWQAVVFGFGGLRLNAEGWKTSPHMPKHWKRLSFKFFQHGKIQVVDIQNPSGAETGNTS